MRGLRTMMQYDSGEGMHPKQLIEDTLKELAETNKIDLETLKEEFCKEFEYLCSKLGLKMFQHDSFDDR